MFNCPCCGPHHQPYVGDPAMCVRCGSLEEELSQTQREALEMMDEEGVEKVRSEAGGWIGRDDIRVDPSSADEAIQIIRGVRALAASEVEEC